jgi:urease accessory protein
VGADLEVMKADTARMRPDSARRPWVMTNLKTLQGVEDVVRFIEQRGMLAVPTTA